MGKEVKIGLAVIFVLLGVFGYALYSRLKAGSTEAAVATKPAASKEKEAGKKVDVPKLSSGPAKTLSSGPTKKLSSGPIKTGDAARLSSGPATATTSGKDAASNAAAATASTTSTLGSDRYSRSFSGNQATSIAGDSQSTAASSDPLTSPASRSTSSPTDRYADRYGDYRSSASSAIEAAASKFDQAADRVATKVEEAAERLASDPFSQQQAGSPTANAMDSTATLLQDVKSAATSALKEVGSAVEQQSASTLDRTRTSFDQQATTQMDKAAVALDNATDKLQQAASSALDQANAAINRAADSVSSAALDTTNPLRSATLAADNAQPGQGASTATSRLPRARYDFYGDSPATKTTSGVATDTATSEAAAAVSGAHSDGASASFRSSRSAAAGGDRYGSSLSTHSATNGQSSAQQSDGTAASSNQTANQQSANQVSPLPRSNDSWTGAGNRTSSAATARDSRYDRYASPATTQAAAGVPASSSPLQARSRTAPGSSSAKVPSSSPTTPVVPRDTVSSSSLPSSTASSGATATAIVPSGKTYTVEPNDNYWVISEKLYGTGSYFKALEHHNRQRFPRGDLLRTGDVIDAPAAEALTASYPSLCPKASHVLPPRSMATLSSQRGAGGRSYVVEEGDTLFDIARYELGKATRWAEIYQLNRDQIGPDFNHLRPGTQLVLPEDAGDTFTRRPSPGIHR